MPNIFDYNPQNIHPFPYWKWNKVLPAVYDDSLSQYEILCKLLSIVNSIIESTNSTGEQVEQLTQLIQQLIDGEFPSGIVQYVTDIANAAIDDDIETINNTISEIQSQIDIIKESDYPISYFGAVGDGVTDDTVALNTALNGNKTVSLKSNGIYRATDIITVGNNTVVDGNGATIRFTNDVSGNKFITGETLSNCIFRDIVFDFGTNAIAKYGVSFISSNNIIFDNCTFKNVYGGALRLNNSTHIKINNCNFINISGESGMPGECIYASDISYLYVNECYAENIYDHFVYIAGTTEADNISITNCFCLNTGINTTTNGAAVVFYANTHDCVIDNLVCKNSRMVVFVGNYSTYTTLPKNISINNIIGQNITLDGIGIVGLSTANVYNISVNNVILNTVGQDGIHSDYVERATFNNITVNGATRNGFNINGNINCVYSNIYANGFNCFIIQRTTSSAHSTYCIFDNIVCSSSGASQNGFYHRNGDFNRVSNITIVGTFTTYPYFINGLNIQVNDASENYNSLTFDDGTDHTYHKVGDLVVFPNAASGQPLISLCTVAGVPGTLQTIVSRP